jgi:hypothetical protein
MARHNQQALDFLGFVRLRATGSLTLLQHAESGLLKRNRAPTTSAPEPTLPPYRRTRAIWKAPALKPTNSYMFKGVHPLYTRHVIEDRHEKMLIRCSQVDYIFEKVIDRVLHGTNNFKSHYHRERKGIPTCESEAKLKIQANAAETGPQFFDKPVSNQTHDKRFRNLLLEWVIKNNLSFVIVDQPETKALFSFLSPSTKQISRPTLIISEDGSRIVVVLAE